ncbi:c-type cytochrome [Porticoccus sp.]|uniref:c-type cytochrome n=1 Tax=Porticoccus sp. TaxID=2024853 RepID=UPI003F696E65
MLNKLCMIATAVFCLGLSACSDRPDSSVDSGTPARVAEPSAHPGEPLVKANCRVCHASGINGAPIIGNPKMWASKISQGEKTLVQHAIEGYGLMPARGGSELTDQQMAQAVSYMLSQLTTEPQ